MEFIRTLVIKKPEIGSYFDCFSLLIHYLIEGSKNENHLIYTVLYIINDTKKRQNFRNLWDFYKIFAVFTKSENNTKPQDDVYYGQNEVPLENCKRIVSKMLKTWPGILVLMNDKMCFRSLIESLNTESSVNVKQEILKLINYEILDEFKMIDNFSVLRRGDDFFARKITLAYLIIYLDKMNFYNILVEFIEKENNTLKDFVFS